MGAEFDFRKVMGARHRVIHVGTGNWLSFPVIHHVFHQHLTHTLRDAAMADGILEAALLVTYEGRYRPDQTPYEPWLDFQRGKVGRGLAAMAANPPAAEPLTVAGIGLACALEYIDFREQYDWRPEFPALVAWLDAFNATHPAFAESKPSA